jgi:hypothetical protein
LGGLQAGVLESLQGALGCGACENVEIVKVVTVGCDGRVISPRDQEKLSVVHRLGEVEVPFGTVDPLHGPSVLGISEAVVVGLLEFRLALLVVLVLVRGVARPVAARGPDLDDVQPISGESGEHQAPDLPRRVATAAELDVDIVRGDQNRRELLVCRGFGNRDLKVGAGGQYHLGVTGKVEAMTQAGEHARPAAECPGLAGGRHFSGSGQGDEGPFLPIRQQGQRLTCSQSLDRERHIGPARVGRIDAAPALAQNLRRAHEVV